MDKRIQHALARDRTIDIITRGRNTGQLRRTEIWFHHIHGQVYITGTPGRRDWYANLVAHPELTFHLKQTVTADLPVRARPIRDNDPPSSTVTRCPLTMPAASAAGLG
jgi:hypothetical protein